jgi:hypothetical protein
VKVVGRRQLLSGVAIIAPTALIFQQVDGYDATGWVATRLAIVQCVMPSTSINDPWLSMLAGSPNRGKQ